MIILTNSTSLTLGPGQSATFDTVIMHTGCAECHRNGSGAVTLNMKNAIYEIAAGGNIGATTAGENANLTIFIDGSPLSETEMNHATAAVGDVNNVFRSTFVPTCCYGVAVATVRNNGESTIVLENPILKIKRVA